MKYVVTQRIICGLAVPDGKELEIDGFTFLTDVDNNQLATRIRAEVEANTPEEAQRKAYRTFAQFLSKLTILDNSQYIQLNSFHISAKQGQVTTASIIISTTTSLSIDGNFIKDKYQKTIKRKRIHIRPLQHYSKGINSSDPFEKFQNFYLVLSNYHKEPKDLTAWIRKKLPTIEMKDDDKGHKKNITIISWIRHRLSHAATTRNKQRKVGLNPLLISNPEHVLLVQKYLPIIQELAREIIRERESI